METHCRSERKIRVQKENTCKKVNRYKETLLIIKNGCNRFGCEEKRSHIEPSVLVARMYLDVEPPTDDLLSVFFAIYNSCKSKFRSMSVE